MRDQWFYEQNKHLGYKYREWEKNQIVQILHEYPGHNHYMRLENYHVIGTKSSAKKRSKSQNCHMNKMSWKTNLVRQ